MPKTCELLDTSLMYPDNWTLNGPVSDEESEGFTLESPTGMFFSVNRYPNRSDRQNILEQAISAMQKEYQELECNPWNDEQMLEEEDGFELNFYYQNYLITSRLLAIDHETDVLLIQIQAENRDFDENELVFSAMLKSFRSSL